MPGEEHERVHQVAMRPEEAAPLVNKYFGRFVRLSPSGTVYVFVERDVLDVPAKIEKPEDLEHLFNALVSLCEVEEKFDSGHPLGRGWVVFNCGKKRVEVEIHGDWPGMLNYVTVSVLPRREP